MFQQFDTTFLYGLIKDKKSYNQKQSILINELNQQQNNSPMDMNSVKSLILKDNQKYQFLIQIIESHNHDLFKDHFCQREWIALAHHIYRMLLVITQQENRTHQLILLARCAEWTKEKIDKIKLTELTLENREEHLPTQDTDTKYRPFTTRSTNFSNSETSYHILKDYFNYCRTLHSDIPTPQTRIKSYNSRQILTEESVVVQEVQEQQPIYKKSKLIQDTFETGLFLREDDEWKCNGLKKKKKKSKVSMTPDYKYFSNSQAKEQNPIHYQLYLDEKQYISQIKQYQEYQQDRDEINIMKQKHLNPYQLKDKLPFSDRSVQTNNSKKNNQNKKLQKSSVEYTIKKSKIQRFKNRFNQIKENHSEANLKAKLQTNINQKSLRVLTQPQKNDNRPFSAIIDSNNIANEQQENIKQVKEIKSKLQYYKLPKNCNNVKKGIEIPNYEPLTPSKRQAVNQFEIKLINNPYETINNKLLRKTSKKKK